MLRLSDFIAGRKRFYNLSRRLCILARKHSRKKTFITHIHLTVERKVINIVMLSDFVTCSETNLEIYNIHSLEKGCNHVLCN